MFFFLFYYKNSNGHITQTWFTTHFEHDLKNGLLDNFFSGVRPPFNGNYD